VPDADPDLRLHKLNFHGNVLVTVLNKNRVVKCYYRLDLGSEKPDLDMGKIVRDRQYLFRTPRLTKPAVGLRPEVAIRSQYVTKHNRHIWQDCGGEREG
jgi:hypothetical protein